MGIATLSNDTDLDRAEFADLLPRQVLSLQEGHAVFRHRKETHSEGWVSIWMIEHWHRLRGTRALLH